MPLSDSYDAKYVAPGATVRPYTFAGRIEQVGLESLRVMAPPLSVPINEPQFNLLGMNAVRNGWVKDVAGVDVTNGISLGSGTKWVTVQDSSIVRITAIDNAEGYPFQYAMGGQQCLVQRCTAQGSDVDSAVNQGPSGGVNVVLGMTATGTTHLNVQAHQRWSTGFLIDSVVQPTGGIQFQDQGTAGSGHGWATGWSVVWNSTAASLLIQEPPGSQNWSIGTTGTETTAPPPGSTITTPLPEGAIDSPGVVVAPKSLYLAQLCERLGPAAVHAIGY